MLLRNLNFDLIPFLILTYDRRVDTENNDGAGSAGKGGGTTPDFIASCASCCARYFSYSVNDKLLLETGRFLACNGDEVSSSSFEDLDVMPVDALPCDPDDAVLA